MPTVLEDIFAGKFDHQMTAACGPLLEAVSHIQEHLVGADRPVWWTNRTANETVQVPEVLTAVDL